MTQVDVELTPGGVLCACLNALQYRSYRHAWLVPAEMSTDHSRVSPKTLTQDGVTGLPHGFTGLILTR